MLRPVAAKARASWEAEAMKYYLIHLEPYRPDTTTRCIGPFDSPSERDRTARNRHADDRNDTELLLWADVTPDGALKVGCICKEFFEDRQALIDDQEES